MAALKTYRAITEVHITETPGKAGDKSKGIAPTPPKVVIIPAKSLFEIDPDSETCKELLSKSAIALVKDTEKSNAPIKVSGKTAPAKKAPAKKAPAKKADPEAGKDEGEGKDDDGENLV